ncbi:MAG TPA: rod shape-determining protein MreC [Gammaproteobacteria bacterium]
MRGPSLTARLLVLVLASLALMTLDHRYRHLETARAVLSTALYPLQSLVNLPADLAGWLGESLASRQALLEENARLHDQHVRLRLGLQRLAALEQENGRLRRLLEASEQVTAPVLVAELLAVDVDPYRHQVVVNKGQRDGVYLNQPLLAAEGVMGQVVHLNPFAATAMLITDPSHALPVQVNRTGMRTVAQGTGTPDKLSLPFISNDADLAPGDLLVTSGLGGRFPRGYPVAVVTTVERDPGKPFATVLATPAVHLDRSLEVLLVQAPGDQPPAASTAPEVAAGSDGGAPAAVAQ